MSTWLLSFFWLLPFTEGKDDRAVAIKALESIIAAYDKAGSFSFNAHYSQKFFDLDTHYVVTARVEGNTDAVFMAADARRWLGGKWQTEIIYASDANYHIESEDSAIRRSVHDTSGEAARGVRSNPNSSAICPMISRTFNIGKADLGRIIERIKGEDIRFALNYKRGDSMTFTVWYPEWVGSGGHSTYYVNTRVPCITAIRDTAVMDGKQQIMSTTIESFRYSEKPFSVEEKLESFVGYRMKIPD